MEYVTSTDGTRLAYERAGSGTPLVLVHGTGVEHFSFRALEPLLVDRFTVCSVDRRGRGESGDSADSYTIDQEFADIATLVDSFDGPTDLFGHSYGATLALGASALARNLRRLILYEPAPGVPQVPPALLTELEALLVGDQRERLLGTFFAEAGLDRDALEQLRSSPLWKGRVAAAHTIPRELRAEEGYQPDQQAHSRRSIPTLLLRGTESPDWAQSGTEVAHSVLSHSQLKDLDGEAHLAILTAPQLVADQLTRFLNEQGTPIRRS
jgi:pimeloyl-ACP methyl ester carboxylesterase